MDYQLSSSGKYPTSWSSDGEIVYHVRRPESGFDVLVAEARPGSTARALLDTSSNEVQGQLSPDGRWLAYTSDESNRPEVYIRAKAGGPRKPVSVRGGIDPKWARTSGELFYIDTTSRRLTSVAVSFRDTDVVLGAPRELFEVRRCVVLPALSEHLRRVARRHAVSRSRPQRGRPHHATRRPAQLDDATTALTRAPRQAQGHHRP